MQVEAAPFQATNGERYQDIVRQLDVMTRGAPNSSFPAALCNQVLLLEVDRTSTERTMPSTYLGCVCVCGILQEL